MDDPARAGSGEPGAGAGRRPAWIDEEVEEVSLLELVNVLLKRWKLVLGLPLVAALLAAVVSLILPAKFTSSASFVPESEGQGLNLPSGLTGLASQFGVSVPSAGGTSPTFYADVLRSRTLRDGILLGRFPDPRAGAAGDSASLLDILDVAGANQAERLEAGRRALDGITSVRVDNETSVVTVSVETRYPTLSAGVANLYVALLNRFNLETRQTNAQQRRRFIEERIGEAEAELRQAEEALKRFLERNRQFRNSPELSFEYDRLERQVRIKEEVFTTLRRQYEEARIQEVNDTPVITVIDRAVPPEEKSSPKRKLNVILAFVLGGVLGIVGAFGREFVERARQRDQEEYREFASRWAAVKSELRSLVRRQERPPS